MDRKKLNRVVMVLPVVTAILVVAVILVLILGAGNTPTAPETQFAALTESNAGMNEVTEMTDDVETDGEEDFATDTGPACEFGFLVGLGSEEAVEKIKSLDRPYRVIAPYTAVTQDYRPDRINLMVDEAGVVESVDCG